MLKAVKIAIAPCLIFLLGFSSCDKDQNFPDEPFLEFRDYTELSGDSLSMRCYFRDGNGDIGTAVAGDTCVGSPDLVIGYQELIDGEWTTPDGVTAEFCVPSITPRGQDKTLEGDVIGSFPNPLFLSTFNGDSVRYSMMLRDAAGNESNLIIGPLLVND